jgi:predicted Zn-dependent peptidase
VALARRLLPAQIYGADHPYGLPGDGLGRASAVAAATPASLSAAHREWLSPGRVTITVVGDVTMERLVPELERAFGSWQAPQGALSAKPVDAAPAPPRPRIVLVDRPNSPQSVIAAGRVLGITGRDSGNEALELANEVLGDGFLSRLNMQLREEKGWSYGVQTAVTAPVGRRALTVLTPVQADRTGDSITLILDQMKAFPAIRPVDPVELSRVTDGNIRGLPNRFESNGQVLNALLANQRLGRADDYQASLPDRYRAVDATAINAAAARWLGPDGLVIVVVGDRKQVEPQLAKLGLPVEIDSSVDSSPAKD